jgi:hypothetical protein
MSEQTGKLSRGLALRIIQALGESGTPPDRGVTWLNVGNDSYFDVLQQEYFDLLLPAGGAGFKLVQAYYGGGKTHFLLCLRERAWASDFVTAYVGLSPQECPFHEPLLVYRAVVRAMRAPPRGDDALVPTTGLADLLRDLVEDRRAEHGDAAVRTWIVRTVRQIPVENRSLRNAIAAYCEACLDDDVRRQDVLAAWLSGDDLPPSAHRDYGVFESVTRANAFAMLRSVCQALRALGFEGTALLFDEMDRNLSITGARRQTMRRLTDNLRELVDQCAQAKLPGVLMAYAVPPEFLRTVVPEYPALQQRLSAPVALSQRSPMSPLIDLEHLDLEPVSLLTAIGERITEVFQEARGVQLDPILQSANLARLAEESARSQFEVSHRRVFVKSWVGLLHDQIAQGEHAVAPDAVSARIMGDARGLLGGPGGDDDGFDDY